jgi:Fe-S-cluster containining protein
MPALDCKTCGACCIGGMDDDLGFADVSPGEIERIKPWHRRHLKVITILDDARMSTPGVFTEEFGKICGFLRGDPGVKVSCEIYASRPGVCARFRPGGMACLESRKELGL